MGKKRFSAFYGSVIFYVLFIFLTQWSLSAAKMNEVWLHDILSNTVAFMILPVILALTIYNILNNVQYYIRRRWFTIFFVITLLFIAVASKSLSLTLPLLLGFTGFAAENRKIVKVALLSFVILLCVSYMLSLIGFNGGDTISKPLFGTDRADVMEVTALGLANPNAAMLVFINIIVLSLLLCKTKKQDLITSAMLITLTVVLSVATGSTTGIIMGLATILIMLYAKYGKKASKRLHKITPWMFILVTALTFLIAIGFGSGSSDEGGINDIFSGRPELWNLRIENNSYINLYGNNDQYQVNRAPGSNEPTQALDNAPLYMLVYLGALVYFIFWYIFYVGSKHIKDTALLVYVVVATLLMFTEKMELYGLALVFLQKSITEHHLLRKKQSLVHIKQGGAR